jgi:hypothetical protein
MKILVTENQIRDLVGKLKTNKLINEGTISNEEYSDEVKVDVEVYGVKINGDEIDWATCGSMDLSYTIGIERSSWGIKGIDVYDIKGPSEFEIEITPQTEDSQDNILLTLPYSWENVQIEEERGRIIGIDNEIRVILKNTENGEIAIDYVSVTVFTL